MQGLPLHVPVADRRIPQIAEGETTGAGDATLLRTADRGPPEPRDVALRTRLSAAVPEVEDVVAGAARAGNASGVLDPTPSGDDLLRPTRDARGLPARNAAAQRRAMQAAIANAVRAMRTVDGRRGSRPGERRAPPPADL
jgi:hypothetical protein